MATHWCVELRMFHKLYVLVYVQCMYLRIKWKSMPFFDKLILIRSHVRSDETKLDSLVQTNPTMRWWRLLLSRLTVYVSQLASLAVSTNKQTDGRTSCFCVGGFGFWKEEEKHLPSKLAIAELTRQTASPAGEICLSIFKAKSFLSPGSLFSSFFSHSLRLSRHSATNYFYIQCVSLDLPSLGHLCSF